MGAFGLFRGIPVLDVERFNISPAVSLFWSRKSAVVILDIAQARACDLWGKVHINLRCTSQREYVLFFFPPTVLAAVQLGYPFSFGRT